MPMLEHIQANTGVLLEMASADAQATGARTTPTPVRVAPLAILEPLFSRTKEARGLRRFLLRSLEKVNAEWSLMCTGHNLLKLFRATTTLA